MANVFSGMRKYRILSILSGAFFTLFTVLKLVASDKQPYKCCWSATVMAELSVPDFVPTQLSRQVAWWGHSSTSIWINHRRHIRGRNVCPGCFLKIFHWHLLGRSRKHQHHIFQKEWPWKERIPEESHPGYEEVLEISQPIHSTYFCMDIREGYMVCLICV